MVRHAEFQAGLARRLFPDADNILLRPDAQAVPGVIAAVIAIEIVVMAGQRHEIFRAGLLIFGHQRIGIPLVGGPQILDVLHPRDRRMAVGLEVMLVHRVTLHIHEAAIPVALRRHRLRPPVRPHAQLRVAEPVGIAVIVDQRGPACLHRAPGGAHRAGRAGGIGQAQRSRARQEGSASEILHHFSPSALAIAASASGRMMA